MRRIVSALLLLFVIVGCRPTSAFVRAVDATWEVVGPEYGAYVASDPKLSDSDRQTRLRTVELMDRLIAEEKAR